MIANTLIAGLLLVTGLGSLTALMLILARRRFEPETDSLIIKVNNILPQTQCAQCGYPGCRPYAEAVVNGEAINRCPPGGSDTIAALANLLGRESEPLDPACGEFTPPQLAVIREPECIGCTLCMLACPVDAIVGATGQMHTVIESLCTGCDLCTEPCPVDCIDLIDGPAPAPALEFLDAELPCINCGECATACPRDLQPQLLYWYRKDTETTAEHRLDDCIECGRCDKVCPSDLPLTHSFKVTKAHLRAAADLRAEAVEIEQRFQQREARLIAQAAQVVKRPSADARKQLLASLQDDS